MKVLGGRFVYVNPEKTAGSGSWRRRAVVRDVAVGAGVSQAGHQGYYGERHRRRGEDRRAARSARSAQLSQRQTVRETRQQVRPLAHVKEASESQPPRRQAGVRLDKPRRRACRTVVERGGRADSEHARGDRHASGTSRSSEGTRRRLKEQYSALGRPRRPRGAELMPTKARGMGLVRASDKAEMSRGIRGLHAQRARANCAAPRGHPDRGRPLRNGS